MKARERSAICIGCARVSLHLRMLRLHLCQCVYMCTRVRVCACACAAFALRACACIICTCADCLSTSICMPGHVCVWIGIICVWACAYMASSETAHTRGACLRMHLSLAFCTCIYTCRVHRAEPGAEPEPESESGPSMILVLVLVLVLFLS